ncbi:MAG: barstar family protein [Rhodocyclaceae bacterium]|nr:barstar family protein [Rhodocyclaceae bacterium]
MRDRTTLFECLATTLKFPDWFGHNWDALADCLSDLSGYRQRSRHPAGTLR